MEKIPDRTDIEPDYPLDMYYCNHCGEVIGANSWQDPSNKKFICEGCWVALINSK